MTLREGNINSDVSVSWQAHREAETLLDASMINELADYLEHESNKERRKAAYFMLGHLGKNLSSPECARVLVARSIKENNKYVLSTLLGALQNVAKPSDLDLSPIFALLGDGRWLVRHSAIESLVRTNSPEVEDHLIHHLETTTDPFDVAYCQGTLNQVGTAKAIPFIAKNLKSRKRDVKDSAQAAIEAIQARERSKNG
jgi:HEAT repeat protein